MTDTIDISELAMYKRPRGKGRTQRHEPGRMNKLEGEYAATLSATGKHYRFESMKFRLADNTYYTPDFMVMGADGLIEFHEVKGFWEDDARVKVKVFAEMFPEFSVKAVTKCRKTKQWVVEEFGGV